VRSHVLILVLAVAHFVPALARADNTIFFGPCQPVAGTGQVSASGIFTVDPSWQVTAITLYAVNPLGGVEGSTSKGTIGATTWDSFTVSGLPSGTYLVFADLTLTNSCTGATMDVTTPVVSIPVQ
jgi:hypothetical protein